MTIDELLEQPIYTAKSPWRQHRRLSSRSNLRGIFKSIELNAIHHDLIVPTQEIADLIEGYALVIGCRKIKTHIKEFLHPLDEKTRRYYLGNFDVPR